MKTLTDRSKARKSRPTREAHDSTAAEQWDKDQLHSLLYDALETEKGGVLVYQAALRCATNHDLAAEWKKYLEQTQNHARSSSMFWRSSG